MTRRRLIGLLTATVLAAAVTPPAHAAAGWRDVPVPAPAPPATFDHIAAGDAQHAWAAGRENGAEPGTGTPFMVRWDGSAWQREQGFPVAGDHIGALSAASAQDAWAFGSRGTAGADLQWFAWHREQKAWTPYLLPDQEGADVLVYQPLATARGAAWAVSESFTGSVLWHWNGQSWARQQFPAGVAVFGVGARSASDAWAVGYARDGANAAAAMRWNGRRWRVVDTTGLTGALTRVLPVSATSVYAVGSDNGWYLAHWDGTAWARTDLPVTTNAVNAIATNGADRVWLAVQSDHAFQSLYLRYARGRWTKVYGPDRTDVVEVGINGLARVPGTSTLWGAGSATVFQHPPTAVIEERS